MFAQMSCSFSLTGYFFLYAPDSSVDILHVHCCGIFIFILKIKKKIWKCGLKNNAISVNLRVLDVLFLQHFEGLLLLN